MDSFPTIKDHFEKPACSSFAGFNIPLLDDHTFPQSIQIHTHICSSRMSSLRWGGGARIFRRFVWVGLHGPHFPVLRFHSYFRPHLRVSPHFSAPTKPFPTPSPLRRPHPHALPRGRPRQRRWSVTSPPSDSDPAPVRLRPPRQSTSPVGKKITMQYFICTSVILYCPLPPPWTLSFAGSLSFLYVGFNSPQFLPVVIPRPLCSFWFPSF